MSVFPGDIHSLLFLLRFVPFFSQLYRTVVVDRELRRKAKISIHQMTYVPTFTYGHELWEVRLRIQDAKMSFLPREARLEIGSE